MRGLPIDPPALAGRSVSRATVDSSQGCWLVSFGLVPIGSPRARWRVQPINCQSSHRSFTMVDGCVTHDPDVGSRTVPVE